jgi:hypothetical protein
MLDIKDLEVGKKYRHVAGELHPDFKFTEEVFTVSYIDVVGDVATNDAVWSGFKGNYLICDNLDGNTVEHGILKFEEVV